MVIFEKDVPTKCNYALITENLKSHGFTNLVSGFHEVWKKFNPVKIFTSVYENKVWGNNQHLEYDGSSGDGSFLEKNSEYISLLKAFIKDKSIKTVVDLGCGDWKCGSALYDDLPIQYTGYDAYEKIVTFNKKAHGSSKYIFTHMDFLNKPGEINSSDLCIIKDVLQHWPLESIYAFLDYITTCGKFKYIVVTNCMWQKQANTQIQMGEFRPLSKDFLPLKKYNPKLLLSYNAKDVLLLDGQESLNIST
jgi:hypothetical protein